MRFLGDEGAYAIDGVGPDSAAKAEPADELAVVDGETAEGGFGDPGSATVLGYVAQERFAHLTTLGLAGPESDKGGAARKPQRCPFLKWAILWEISHSHTSLPQYPRKGSVNRLSVGGRLNRVKPAMPNAGSACCELRLTEVILPLRIGDLSAPRPVGQYSHATLHRGARRDFVVPALDRWIVGKIDVPPLGAADPRERNYIRHTVFGAREIGRFRQAMLKHPVQAFDLVGVALDRIGYLFNGIGGEVIPLPEHGPDPTHLEHHP